MFKFKLDITVEPVIFLIAFSNGFSTSGTANLILEKICDENGYEKNGTFINPRCLEYSTGLNTLKTMLKECLPVITLLIAGPWRDKHGKNIPLIIVVIIGQILGPFVCLMSSIFWKEMSIMLTVLFESILTGLTGSLALLLMSSICYISSRTMPKDRTFRMSFALGAYLGGIAVGLVFGGLILQIFGFPVLFSSALTLSVLALIYLWLFLHETVTPSKTPLPNLLIFKTIFKKRENNIRSIILMMIMAHCLFASNLICEGNIFFFYAEKSLKLTIAETGYYSSYRSIILTLSTLLIVPLLSKYFRMNDVPLGMLSAIVICLTSVWAAFARTRLELLLFPLGDLIKGSVFAVSKSILTKCVGPNELGQIFGGQAMVEAGCHLIFLPLYTFVYNNTFQILPAAFYFITAMFAVIIFIHFCILQIMVKRNRKLFELINVQDEPAKMVME